MSHQIHFQLDGQRIRASVGPHRVAEVKTMARPPIPEEQILVADVPGGADIELPNGGTVDLSDGLVLYSEGRAGAHPTRMPVIVDGHHVDAGALSVTGTIIRNLLDPPVPDDRDLFRDIDGAPDERIDDDEEVTLERGAEFYSVPRFIAPGSVR